MDERDWLTERVKAHQEHLQAVAFRMLGSHAEAEDAVQEAWIRLGRSDTSEVDNLRGWLTTVVARVCLDMLRSRRLRREDLLGEQIPERLASSGAGDDPERDLVLADSVGVALLVVLEALPPAERVAFVLHDLFDLPFDEIGPIVDRSPTAARQLASRARRRIQGTARASETDLREQRQVVEAFLAAGRARDIDGLLAVLDPEVELRADRVATPSGMATEARGAATVARRAAAGTMPGARAALVDGAVGIVVAPRGRLFRVLRFAISGRRITAIEVIGEPERLGQLEVAVLPA